MENIISKICPRCQQAKPASEFHKNKSTVTGYHVECKECRKIPRNKQDRTLPEGRKRCSACRRIKPLEDFWKSTKAKDGYGFECKECNAKRRVRREKVPTERTVLVPASKQCRKCLETKPGTEFYFKKGANGGGYLDYWCKECSRKRALRPYTFGNHRIKLMRTYGITVEDYDRLYEAQDGVCAACGEIETKVQYGRVMLLAVDHDHETGKVRGLLCADCNRALGLLKDDSKRVAGMLKYIQSWE